MEKNMTKQARELSEEELDQVSGGENLYDTFICPGCGTYVSQASLALHMMRTGCNGLPPRNDDIGG